jgi:hypothetical protein
MAPADLPVVRAEVMDPAGRLARHHTGKVAVRNGKVHFEIPFALSCGLWRSVSRSTALALSRSSGDNTDGKKPPRMAPRSQTPPWQRTF